jgi:hypothetical protein
MIAFIVCCPRAQAQGYTVDYIVALLEKQGFSRVLFDWGGEIKGLGKNLKVDTRFGFGCLSICFLFVC